MATPTERLAPDAWAESARYPDPRVEVLDPRFRRYVLFNAAVERLATGFRWAEGPVWFGDMRCLFWSDIPNDRIMRWDEATGAAVPWRTPSNHANGNTRDRQGRLVTCEHGTRRVTRTEPDGTITVLADRYGGKRLNSPNDVVVKGDGSVWFTDPPFGILSHYEGHAADPEQEAARVYRIDPTTGRVDAVADDAAGPNGLAFSPDERVLYVVESRGDPTRRIRAYDVTADGKGLVRGRTLVDASPGGAPDGFRVDVDGNLWCGWGTGDGLDGVAVFSPGGDLLGRIHLPERCANLCFGGVRRNRLFMAASRSLYALYVNAQGVAGG